MMTLLRLRLLPAVALDVVIAAVLLAWMVLA